MLSGILFIACNSDNAKKNSPIDISNGVIDSVLTPLYNDYYTIDSFKISNKGDFISVNSIYGNALLIPDSSSYLGKEYQLTEILIKSPSEHTISGVHFPVEIQFVHSDSAQNLTIVSVMIEKGDENSFYSPIIDNLPAKDEVKSIVQELDTYSMFPANPDYWYYIGSTTNEPIVDNVKWFVMKETMQMSENQINKIIDAIGVNDIELAELGDRSIFEM